MFSWGGQGGVLANSRWWLLNAFGLSLNEEDLKLLWSALGVSQSRSGVLGSGRERFSEEKLSFQPKAT